MVLNYKCRIFFTISPRVALNLWPQLCTESPPLFFPLSHIFHQVNPLQANQRNWVDETSSWVTHFCVIALVGRTTTVFREFLYSSLCRYSKMVQNFKKIKIDHLLLNVDIWNFKESKICRVVALNLVAPTKFSLKLLAITVAVSLFSFAKRSDAWG